MSGAYVTLFIMLKRHILLYPMYLCMVALTAPGPALQAALHHKLSYAQTDLRSFGQSCIHRSPFPGPACHWENCLLSQDTVVFGIDEGRDIGILAGDYRLHIFHAQLLKVSTDSRSLAPFWEQLSIETSARGYAPALYRS